MRKRKRNRRFFALLVILAIVGLGIYGLVRWLSGEDQPAPVQGAIVDADVDESPFVDDPAVSLPPARLDTAVNPQLPADTPDNPAPRQPDLPAPSDNPDADTSQLVESNPPATRHPIEATGGPALEVLRVARDLVESGKLVEARDVLNRSHATPQLGPSDAAHIRAEIAKLNQTLIFSKKIFPSDPHAAVHAVGQGEYLSGIAPKFDVPWRFVAKINDVHPSRLRIGQKLKVMLGPFHVVVRKAEYRLDVYLGDPSQPGSTFVRSFPVGLGESDSTPLGRFVVRRGGKAENPDWRNPRNSREYYAADDPKNPIGERWIGIRGIEADTEKLSGYGIHGTIEPDSIGNQASMGCVRLADDDVKMLFDMLTEEKSTVTVLP